MGKLYNLRSVKCYVCKEWFETSHHLQKRHKLCDRLKRQQYALNYYKNQNGVLQMIEKILSGIFYAIPVLKALEYMK